MQWNLEGKRINGMYMGLFPYCGRVLESRVKYGGAVSHTVAIEEPIVAFGTSRDRIIVGVDEINRIVAEDELV